MIFSSKRKSSNENLKKLAALKDKANEGIMLQENIEVVNYNKYEVWTEEEFKKYHLGISRSDKNQIDNRWIKCSKGYNFVIAVYRECIKGYDIYSVGKFNELFSREKEKEISTSIKEDDIKIKDISIETNLIYTDNELIDLIVSGFKVNFEYKCFKADAFIEADGVLTIKEIKQKIINNVFRKQKDVKEGM